MVSLRQLFLQNLAQTSDSPLQLEIDRAEGIYLYTPEGKDIIDLISGVSVCNVGHCHPAVVSAVAEQASRYMHLMVYGEVIQYPQVRLAQKLAEQAGTGLDNVYFVNSGSEAVEGAIKLAKRYTRRYEVISCNNAYHGSTIGALSVMGSAEPQRSFRPLMPGTRRIEYNSVADLKQISEQTACVFIEPIQGEGGIISPAPGYLEALRERCTQTGTLLVFDEIQTGMGRTGSLFAFQKLGVKPDILLLAKALGGGMPLGAFISSKEIMGSLTNDPVLGHITTFGGHPVSCAAAIAALGVLLDNGYISAVAEKEQQFRSTLSKHPAVKEIRSNGLFMAIELGSFDKVLKTIHLGAQTGFLTDWFLFCDTAFRIAPPLTITKEEVAIACDRITWVLDRV